MPRRGTQTVAARGRIMDYLKGAETWLKALTEIVTNSHSSYDTMFDEGFQFKEKPKITIHADAQAEKFTVIDHATGIFENWDEVNEVMEKYSRKHKTQTAKARGSFGRGLSDVLYRRYENECVIHSKKSGNGFAVKTFWSNPTNPSSDDNRPDYEEIEKFESSVIPEHGTMISFPWVSDIEKNNPFPNDIDLVRKLCKYYELKNVISDTRLDVELIYVGKDGKEKPAKTLEFFDYTREDLEPSLENITLKIDYKDEDSNPIKIISARAWKTKGTRLALAGDEKTAGLSIEGEYKQIYDLTFFGLDNKFQSAAEHIGGVVVLSSSAKSYMDYMQNRAHPETILKRTREGFETTTNFYRKLKNELETWLKNILERESYSSSASASDAWDEGMDALNEIAEEYLEEREGDGPEEDFKPVELLSFANLEPSIVEGKRNRIKLRINSDRIKVGQPVKFELLGEGMSYFTIEPLHKTVPKPMVLKTKDPKTGEITAKQTNESQIPIIIKCDNIDAETRLYARTERKNGQEAKAHCFLTCIEEADNPPTKDIQFSQATYKAKAFQRKNATLYLHPNVVPPGTKIKLELKSLSSSGVELPISFEDDDSEDKAKDHDFYYTVEDTPTNKYNYRTKRFPFTCNKEGYTFHLKASIPDKPEVESDLTEITIEDADEGSNIIDGWTVVPSESSDTHHDVLFESGTRLVKFFANNPSVRKYLGKNYEEANNRARKIPAVAMYVGERVMEAFLDQLVLMKSETHPGFDYGVTEPSPSTIGRKMIEEKKELIFKHGKKVMEAFAKNISTQTSGGTPQEIVIENGRKTMLTFWDIEREAGVVPVPKVSSLEETRGRVATRTVYHFEMRGQRFEISVYEFDGDFYVVALHDYQKDGKYKLVFPEFDGMVQIYRKPNVEQKWMEGKSLVCTPIKLTEWVGEPNRRIKQTPFIRKEDFEKIPDPPTMNHKGVVLEKSNNWVNEKTGHRLVEYAVREELFSDNDQSMNGCLYQLVESESTLMMALGYVRTKVVKMLQKYDIIDSVRWEKVRCSTDGCTSEASGVDHVLAVFGVHFDGDRPVANSLCKKCAT